MNEEKQRQTIHNLENNKVNLKKKLKQVAFEMGLEIVVSINNNKVVWNETEDGIKLTFSKLEATSLQEKYLPLVK